MQVFEVPIGGGIKIGKDIGIMICEVFARSHDYDVRVGIEAPRHVRVDRKEIREQRLREQARAVAASKEPRQRR